jgi:hypothetical protein
MFGTTKTLLRENVWCGVGIVACPVERMGRGAPLPTVTWEGVEVWVGEEIIPGSDTMWEVAPESIVQLPALKEPAVLFSAATRAEQSHAGLLAAGACCQYVFPYVVPGDGGAVPNA